MRVAVFRAEADAARTMQRLRERAHEAVVAPVLRIVATGATVAPNAYAGVIFTSLHAPAFVAADPAASLLRALPCWCVGDRTAAAARACGFKQTQDGAGDARALAGLVASSVATGPLLFVTAPDRKPDLETALAAAGFAVVTVEVYRAQAIEAWPEETVLRLQNCSAALHFSLRSAEITLALARQAGLLKSVSDWRHACLSAAIGTLLTRTGIRHVTVAATPSETDLLASLDSVGPA